MDHAAELCESRRQPIQPADIGWPTGNGEKLSRCQAQLGQATGLAVALFLFISCGPSYVRRLYYFGLGVSAKNLFRSHTSRAGNRGVRVSDF